MPDPTVTDARREAATLEALVNEIERFVTRATIERLIGNVARAASREAFEVAAAIVEDADEIIVGPLSAEPWPDVRASLHAAAAAIRALAEKG